LLFAYPERHRLVEPEQSQVVLERLGVELGVAGDDLHLAVHVLVGLHLAVQVVLAHPQREVVRRHAGMKGFVLEKRTWSVAFVEKKTGVSAADNEIGAKRAHL